MTTHPIDCDALRELAEKATPGPWHWGPPSDSAWPQGDESLCAGEELVLYGWGYDASGIDGSDEDRAFIAAARTALPALLDENTALRARIDVLRDQIGTEVRSRDEWESNTEDAEHRATRAEAQSAIRGRAVAYAREKQREAEERLHALQAVHRDATSHARRIIAHPDRWIAQGLIDATSNMLSALTGAVTIRGGAVQWRNHAVKAEDRADRAEARIKAVRNVLDQYEQENADTPDRYPTPHGNGLGPTLVDASDISHALDG